MIFDLLTLLPEVCQAYCAASILGRAQAAGHIEVRTTNIRDFAVDKHRTVDDYPYGGGDGMVMMAPPILEALASLPPDPPGPVALMSPAGRALDQGLVEELAREERLVLICGRYEGVDQRVVDAAVDLELSLGDFVLSGGELAALAVVEAVSRLIPGVLGSEGSAQADSFSDGLLEHPHYTRPAEYEGRGVPAVLLSGDHAAIARWRRRESLRRTWRRRPDLIAARSWSEDDQSMLAEIERGESSPQSGKKNSD